MGEFVRRGTGEFCGDPVYVMPFGFQPKLGQRDRVPAKRIGLDHIRPGGVVGAVNVLDPFGTGEQQILGTVFERAAAPILDGRILLLEHGSHGPVEHEDTGIERFEERLLADCK